MGVLTKPSDIQRQWDAYRAAQAASLKAAEVFERVCNERRPDEECQAAWVKVGVAEANLEREWQEYKRIAPARIGTRK